MAANGHFGCTCDHPLFLFNQFGDLERCSLRPGNVHSADDWDGVLKPVVVRYKGRKVGLYFGSDAAFDAPEMYDYPESEGFRYSIRLPRNQILQESIGHPLTRPVGRSPRPVCYFPTGGGGGAEEPVPKNPPTYRWAAASPIAAMTAARPDA